MAAAAVRILGAVRFTTFEGTKVDLPSVPQRRLLAVLALAPGRTMRPEDLRGVLGISSGALRTTVSRLRARIGQATIGTDAVGYRLTGAVDATTFSTLLASSHDRPDRLPALDAALALWHGDALEEFRDEHWARAESVRLEELRAVALDDRAELLITRRRVAEAVADLERQIALHPFRDRSRGLLIAALGSEGRQAEALRAYQDYRRFLTEETGTEPSAAVRAIERAVATGSLGNLVGTGAEPGPRQARETGSSIPAPSRPTCPPARRSPARRPARTCRQT